MEKKLIHYISTKIPRFAALIHSYQIGVQRKFKMKINFPFLPTLKIELVSGPKSLLQINEVHFSATHKGMKNSNTCQLTYRNNILASNPYT